MRSGNYKIRNGKIHAYAEVEPVQYYECGIEVDPYTDKSVSRDVTCKKCLKKLSYLQDDPTLHHKQEGK